MDDSTSGSNNNVNININSTQDSVTDSIDSPQQQSWQRDQPFTRQQRGPKREFVIWGAEDRKSQTDDPLSLVTGAVPWSKYVFADVKKGMRASGSLV